MPVLNIPFGADFESTLKGYILQNCNQNHPNYAKILILTPSLSTAKMLKNSFSKLAVIMPKITSITEIANKVGILPTSDFKLKLKLYSIVRKYLPNFTVSSVFSYIEDFLELEGLINRNQTDFISVLKTREGMIENFASSLQNSLINFLKIHAEWQIFKRVNNLKTQDDINLLAANELLTTDFSLFDAIFLVYFQGYNKLQIDIAKHIAKHETGFVVLCGVEKKSFETELTQSFLTELGGDFTTIEAQKHEAKHFFLEFENTLQQANQLVLKAISYLESNPDIRIGFVCYAEKTGKIISAKFDELNIPITTVFTCSIEENQFFTLFVLCLKAEDVSSYLSLIKNSYTIFAKNDVENFEKTLRIPNLNALKPFHITKPEGETLLAFLQNALNFYRQILTAEALNHKDFKDFEDFLNAIILDAGDFALEDNNLYINLIKNFAKRQKIAKKESENLFILSPVEAKGMRFDKLFLTDLTQNNVPSMASSNKILNYHLQKLLQINAKKEQTEWLDFGMFLASAPFVFASTTLLEFEGGERLVPSRFLLYAFENLSFKTIREVFFQEKVLELKALRPAFSSKLIRKLTPTSFEKLINNPFDFYVNYILKLQIPNQISEELARNQLGIIIHRAIFLFFSGGESIQNSVKKMLYNAGFYYEFLLYSEALRRLQNFFESMWEALIKNKPNKVIMEEKISIFEDGILLEGVPDRIEFYDNEIRIIDYKVYSSEISKISVMQGKKPQLPFLGYIISKLYPEFTGKITLLYYFINLNAFPDVVTIKDVSFETIDDLKIVKNSVEKLIFTLQEFFYKAEEGAFFKNLTRNL